VLHLDLPLVEASRRNVPGELADLSFDDRRFLVRVNQLFDMIEPTLLDIATLSLGYEADSYFAQHPAELPGFQRLLDAAVEQLRRRAAHLEVGVTTRAPTESVAPEIAAALHRKSPLLLYLYAPFERQTAWVHRPPRSIEEDWGALLRRTGSRPIAFAEVSYSSAAENGSSREKQAEFIRRFRRLVAAGDAKKVRFARYAAWRDTAPPSLPSGALAVDRRKAAFYSNRGLWTSQGSAKPAWLEWLKARK
jgi:hypothetical protein